MLFLTKLRRQCQATPDKLALEFTHPDNTRQISYGQLEVTVQHTIAYLQSLGVEAGDRIALQLPKCLEFIYLHLAVMRLGAISLPLNPAFPATELSYFLSDSEAKLLFVDAQAKSRVQLIRNDLPALQAVIFLQPELPGDFDSHLQEVDAVGEDLRPLPDDANATALMIYTSGTTGRPKGAELTHGNLTANLDALHTAWGWQANDVLLHVLPIFHTHGLMVALHGALNAGATAVLLPEFDARLTLDTLIKHPCSVFMAVPTIHQRLLSVPDAAEYDLSHMRLMTSGSARLPDDVFQRYQQTFGYTLLERYGMTETGMNLSNPYQGERRMGSVGLPLPSVEARIVNSETGEPLPDGEVGEVQIRGPHVFKQYWRQPEKTASAFSADGWLRTGDLGLREPNGYFTLKGRAKDLIISGGFNIYPPEVELVLAEHSEVAESAVIGCPDVDWGERVVAVIVLLPNSNPTAEGIINYCRQHLAAYKSPKEVLFVESLPRNAMGKIQKANLRSTLCESD